MSDQQTVYYVWNCWTIFQTSSPPQQCFWIHLSWHSVEQKSCPKIQTIAAAKTNPTTKSVISHHSQSWRHPVQLLLLQEAVNYIWRIMIERFFEWIKKSLIIIFMMPNNTFHVFVDSLQRFQQKWYMIRETKILLF